MGLSSKEVIKRDGLDWISANSFPKKLTQNTTSIIMRSSSRQQQSQINNAQAQSEPLICPRCESSNTKFCYFNNYNKSQPRHFCRACKRHWTKGGTLRNVPLGGARKNKRSRKPSSSASAAAAKNIVSSSATAGGGGGDKTMSEILYQAMTSSSSFPPQNELTKKSETTILATATSIFPPFSAAGLFSAASSPFESSLSSISNSFQTTASGDYSVGTAMLAAQPTWQQLVGNGVDTSSSYHWSFEDLDTLVSADQFSLPWDESLDVIKP